MHSTALRSRILCAMQTISTEDGIDNVMYKEFSFFTLQLSISLE